MSNVIKLLPEFLANQIAAGEVVQRPASLVKELLENSIDAGATKISLIVKEAGKQLVQVIDNGKGMSPIDAKMCFERHATSKISKTEDLFSIRTMGFRGEAMASIAAVAQVELKTRTLTEEMGTLVYIENSKVHSHQPINTPQGTNIAVKNLFYNVPARRNFLKSNTVELKHINDEFIRVALSHSDVEMEFIHSDQLLYKLPPSKLSQRIVGLFGSSYKEQLIPTEEAFGEVSIKGYVGKPHFAKKTRGEQFFFVNHRYFKSPYLHHAVMEAFGNLIQEGCFPFYTLFLTIDPTKIDVNVHPTKTEIKFEDEKVVYGLVLAAVRKALGTHLLEPAIDFDLDVNFIKPLNPTKHQEDSSVSSHHPKSYPSNKNWEQMYEVVRKDKSEYPDFNLNLKSQINNELERSTHQTQLDLPQTVQQTQLYQLHQRYVLSQIKSGLLVIDQQAASERIEYEKYRKNFENKNAPSQQLMFPIEIELNPIDYELVRSMESDIELLGFSPHFNTNNVVVLNGLPVDIEPGSGKSIFLGLIEDFKNNQLELGLANQDNLAHSLAKKTSLKKGIKLSTQEMSTLVDKLFACTTPNFSPDGRKTHILLEINQIEGFFE